MRRKVRLANANRVHKPPAANAFRRIELSEQTIQITSDEAIVRHLFTGETVNPAGQATPVRIGVLQVWSKDGGSWRLLARQAYRI